MMLCRSGPRPASRAAAASSGAPSTPDLGSSLLSGIVDADGITIGWVIDSANRQDYRLLQPVLDQITAQPATARIGTLHLDRGFGYKSLPDETPRLPDQRRQRESLETGPANAEQLVDGLEWFGLGASGSNAAKSLTNTNVLS